MARLNSVVVGYMGHQVMVEAEDERVLRRVRISFSELLDNSPSASRDVLRLQRNNGLFELTVNGESVFAHEELWEVAHIVRHEIIDSFIAAHPDLLWLHAGAAVRDGEAVLFVGPFGHGKSTLVTRLCSRGWNYVSDDIVPVDLTSGYILSFPLTPIVRENPGVELPREQVSEIRKFKVPLHPTTFWREPAPITAVVMPNYSAGTGARLNDYSPAEVALAIVQSGINSEDNAQAAVAFCSWLVGRVPVLKLTYSDPDTATDLIIERLGQRTLRTG